MAEPEGAGVADFRAAPEAERREAWLAWKRAYKLAESSDDVAVLRHALPLVDDLKAVGVAGVVTQATARYLKRRANRYLRRQAAWAPRRYVDLAVAVLSDVGGLDVHTNWLSVDILFGGNRVELARHGRDLRLLPAPDPDPWTRSDQAPVAWDRAQPMVNRLYRNPNTPREVREFAARVIRANGWDWPSLPDAALRLMFDRQSAILPGLGGAEAARRVAAGNLSAARLAGLVAIADPEAIRPAMAAWEALGPSAGERERLARALLGELKAALGRWSGSLEAGRVVAALWDECRETRTVRSGLLPVARGIAGLGSEQSRRLLSLAAREARPSELPQWLDALARQSSDVREPVVAALAEAARGRRLARPVLFLLAGRTSHEHGDTAWRVIHASATNPRLLRELLEWGLIREPSPLPPSVPRRHPMAPFRPEGRRIALASPTVVAMVEAQGPDLMREVVRRQPVVLQTMAVPSVPRFLELVATGTLPRLLGHVPEAAREAAADLVLSRLADGSAVVPFWSEIAKRPRREGDATPPTWLLDHPRVRATASSLEVVEVLTGVAGHPGWSRADDLVRDHLGASPRWPELLAGMVADPVTERDARPSPRTLIAAEIGFRLDPDRFLGALSDDALGRLLDEIGPDGRGAHVEPILRRLRRDGAPEQAAVPLVERAARSLSDLLAIVPFLQAVGAERAVAVVPARRIVELLRRRQYSWGRTPEADPREAEQAELARVVRRSWVPVLGAGPLIDAIGPLPESDAWWASLVREVAADADPAITAATVSPDSLAGLLWVDDPWVAEHLRPAVAARALDDAVRPEVVTELGHLVHRGGSTVPPQVIAWLHMAGLDAVAATLSPAAAMALLAAVQGALPGLADVLDRRRENPEWDDAFWEALPGRNPFGRWRYSSYSVAANARWVLEALPRPSRARLRAMLQCAGWWSRVDWARLADLFDAAVAAPGGEADLRAEIETAPAPVIAALLPRLPFDVDRIVMIAGRGPGRVALDRDRSDTVGGLADWLAERDGERVRFFHDIADHLAWWLRFPQVRELARRADVLRLLLERPGQAVLLVQASDDDWAPLRQALAGQLAEPATARRFWASKPADPWSASLADRLLDLAGDVADGLQGDEAAEIALRAGEARWPEARRTLLRVLARADGATEFWAWVVADPSRESLPWVADPEVLAAMPRARTVDVLRLRDPRFDEPLTAWFAARRDLTGAGSDGLVRAATHRLPGLRRAALAALLAGRPDLSAMVRLAESDLPECVAATREALRGGLGGSDVTATALALLDSPSRAVRDLGWGYVDEHAEQVDRARLAAALAEHDDVGMLARAMTLAEETGRPEAGLRRRVLRMRGEGRRAKELVKRAESARPSLAPTDLVELFESRSGREAEWAATELARRALAGEALDGVVVEGPVER